MIQSNLFNLPAIDGQKKPGDRAGAGGRAQRYKRCRHYIEATCRPDGPEECSACDRPGRWKRATFQGFNFDRITADKLTFPDIKRALRAAYMTAKITKHEQNETKYKYLIEQCLKPVQLTYVSSFENSIDELGSYLPALNKGSWAEYRADQRALRAKRAGLMHYWKADDKGNRNFNNKKIQFARVDYNGWASKVWKGRGAPTFNKRKISGVIFEGAYTSRKRNGSISGRWVGVYINRSIVSASMGRVSIHIKIQN